MVVLTFILAVLCPLLLFAETAPSEPAVDYDRVHAAAEQLATRSGATAMAGVAVLSLSDSSEVVVDFNGRKGFIPASTTKVLTSAAALDALGPDFTFATMLEISGVVDAGILKGSVWIKGSGDPTLAEYGGDKLFASWRAALQEAGIASVEGAIVGDASLFETQQRPGSWAWADLGNYYACGASGLNFRQNTFRVHFRPGSVGSRAKFLRTEPALSDVVFHNEMRTGAPGSGDQGYVYAAAYSESVFLRGSIPAGVPTFSIKGALPDPALACAHSFTSYLEKHGLAVSEEATTVRRMRAAGLTSVEERQTLHTHQSSKLGAILLRMNHKSINIQAESVLKALGRQVSGGQGSTQSGTEAVKKFFQKHQISTVGFAMQDGAGLSRLNQITPRQMVYVLKAADAGEYGATFRRSLPVAGKSGTLKSVARGTAAVGRVRAKSGTIARVKCYAGYVDARSGDRYAFAIMVNNYTGSYGNVKPAIERVMARLAEL